VKSTERSFYETDSKEKAESIPYPDPAHPYRREADDEYKPNTRRKGKE